MVAVLHVLAFWGAAVVLLWIVFYWACWAAMCWFGLTPGAFGLLFWLCLGRQLLLWLFCWSVAALGAAARSVSSGADIGLLNFGFCCVVSSLLLASSVWGILGLTCCCSLVVVCCWVMQLGCIWAVQP